MNKNLDSLRFGTGGIPLTTSSRNTVDGIKRINELGLQHMELEFVYSVYVKEDQAAEVKAAAEANDVTLSVHGSYYTNLAATDKQKWHASITRLVQAASIGELAGARSITFHSAFFTGQTEEAVLAKVSEALSKAFVELKAKHINTIELAPELTGKRSQFGSLSELANIVKSLSASEFAQRTRYCIDFAHQFARTNGQYGDEAGYREMLDFLTAELGEQALQNVHIHMSGIEYSDKGERNHLTFLGSYAEYKDHGIELPELEPLYDELQAKNRAGGVKQDWRALLKVLKEYKVTGYVVCESPNLEQDALLMQQVYNSL